MHRILAKFFAPAWATIVAAAVGACTWWYVAAVTHRREAWDADLYFTMAFPVIAIVAVVLAFLYPWKPWRWAMIPFGAQAVAGFVKDPTANLLPLGLIMFAILGGLCAIPAAFVARLRVRFFRA
jgi:hypothetical protein